MVEGGLFWNERLKWVENGYSRFCFVEVDF